LGHAKLLSLVRRNRAGVPAQHRAATTQTPRRPIGAGRGERSEPIRLSLRDTRSLCEESPAQISTIGAVSNAAWALAAAHLRRRSSNANSLCWGVLAQPAGVITTSQIHRSYLSRACISEFESSQPSQLTS